MIKLIKFLKVLTIGYLVILQVSLGISEIHSRIVGGTLSMIKEAPFLVRLMYHDMLRCGGTLIAPRFVVTAAHCVDGTSVDSLTVIAGVTYTFQTGVKSDVITVVLSEYYNSYQKGWDVAVLKLRSPMRGPNIQPTGLCNTHWGPFADVQIYGWGRLNETATDVSHQLRKATVQIVETSICEYMYRDHIPLTNTMFCASTPGRKDACVGDSGGPAIINGQFCGVISFNVICGNHKYPSVYTNVLRVRKFIINSMNTLCPKCAAIAKFKRNFL